MLKIPSFDFNDSFNVSTKYNKELSDLVVKNGAVLIKNVPDFKNAYSFISQFAVYKNMFLTWAHLKNFPGTVEVSNIINPDTQKTGWFNDKELDWHTNGIFMKDPETCVALFCSIPPREGGTTEIINMRKVYNDLDEKTKTLLKDVQIAYENTDETYFYAFDDFESSEFIKHSQRHVKNKASLQDKEVQYQTTKNLVYKHPIDGKYGLYFPFTLFKSTSNFSSKDSENTFRKIQKQCLLEKYRMFIKWEKNDFLLMDQIHTIHRRQKFTGKRQLFRICFDWKRQSYVLPS